MPLDERGEERDADAEGDVGASHSRATSPHVRDSDEQAMAATIQAPGATSGTHLAPGTLLEGTYRVEELLGKGAMGAVYLVEHIALGTKFAAKVVADTNRMDAAGIARLRNEARMASAIDHENIVRVTHLGQTDSGNVFVVMERLHGEDLRARTVDHRRAVGDEGGDAWLSDREVRGIVGPLLSALEAAHAAGVVHRDLKPENVFLHVRQGRIVPKIVDFGIGKQRSHDEDIRLTATGQIVGTPLYMAPEQTRSTSLVDHRADIYAMGVMLFELLTGRLPFEASGVYEIVVKHVTEAPPDPRTFRPDLREDVAALVLRCLAKKPEDRFQSAAELLAAWEDAWGLGSDVPSLSARGDLRHSDPQVDERRGSGSGQRKSGPSKSGSRATAERASAAPGVSSAVQTLAAPEPVVATAVASSAPSSRTWIYVVAVGVSIVLLMVFVVIGALAGGLVLPALPGSSSPVPSAIPPPGPAPAEPVEEAVAEPAVIAEPEPVPEPAPALVRLIQSEPTGAEVLRDGVLIGVTPLELALPGGAPIEVELRARGRTPVERAIGPSDPETILVTLPRARTRPGSFPGLAPQ